MQKQVEENSGYFKRNVELFQENIKIKFLLSDIRYEKKDLQQQLVSFWFFILYQLFKNGQDLNN